MNEPRQPIDLGRIVGLSTSRPVCFDESTGRHFSGDVTGTIDVLLNNFEGETMLIRLPIGEKVLNFLAGKATGNAVSISPVNIDRLEEERKAREAVGTAQEPVGNCPVCLQPQYRNRSGVACLNGHGFEGPYVP